MKAWPSCWYSRFLWLLKRVYEATVYHSNGYSTCSWTLTLPERQTNRQEETWKTQGSYRERPAVCLDRSTRDNNTTMTVATKERRPRPPPWASTSPAADTLPAAADTLLLAWAPPPPAEAGGKGGGRNMEEHTSMNPPLCHRKALTVPLIPPPTPHPTPDWSSSPPLPLIGLLPYCSFWITFPAPLPYWQSSPNNHFPLPCSPSCLLLSSTLAYLTPEDYRS